MNHLVNLNIGYQIFNSALKVSNVEISLLSFCMKWQFMEKFDGDIDQKLLPTLQANGDVRIIGGRRFE